MIKLETGRGSDNDKHNKHHKYTLDEALTSSVEIQRWKWLLRFIWLELSLKYQSNDCNQLQLVFVTDHLQQKKLDDTDVSNNYLLFRSHHGQIKHSCILYFCTTLLLEQHRSR